MRRKDIIKILRIYYNDFSKEFRKKLSAKKKEELEKELFKINKKVLKKNLFTNKDVIKVYQNIVLKRRMFEEDKKIIKKYKNEFSLLEKDYWDNYTLYQEVIEFLKSIVPRPTNYYLREVKCKNLRTNYYIKEHLEIIKNLDISLTLQNRVKKVDVRKFKELVKTDFQDKEIESILFVGVKYFEKYEKIDLKDFYKFFFSMDNNDILSLIKILMPYIKIEYKNFNSVLSDLLEILKKLTFCVKVSNLKDFVIYRKLILPVSNYKIIKFKEKYIKPDEIKFDFYEEFIYSLLKAFLDLLSILGFVEVERRENDLVVDIFYGNIYAVKLSNIGLWYFEYKDQLKLPKSKKSEVKVFNKILAVIIDENDALLKSKIEKFFTKKGKFYFLDEVKILKDIKSKNELQKRIEEIKSIIELSENFENYFNKLLDNFIEVKNDFVVLDVGDKIGILQPLRDLYLLAEDNKIIVKDFDKFKKEAKKLGIIVTNN
jgi:hypothetical protein